MFDHDDNFISEMDFSEAVKLTNRDERKAEIAEIIERHACLGTGFPCLERTQTGGRTDKESIQDLEIDDDGDKIIATGILSFMVATAAGCNYEAKEYYDVPFTITIDRDDGYNTVETSESIRPIGSDWY